MALWSLVNARHGSKLLESTLQPILQINGWTGSQTRSSRRTPELKQTLSSLEVALPPHVIADQQVASANGGLAPSTSMSWARALLPDFKRAAIELFGSIRATGAPDIRSWLKDEYTGDLSGVVWTDLWTSATQMDYILCEAVAQGGEAMVLQTLATIDVNELGLRRLGYFLYIRRTGDVAGANQILAVQPPGSSRDILPHWLISDGAEHSKAEHQWDERAKKNSKMCKEETKGRREKKSGKTSAKMNGQQQCEAGACRPGRSEDKKGKCGMRCESYFHKLRRCGGSCDKVLDHVGPCKCSCCFVGRDVNWLTGEELRTWASAWA